MEELWRDAYENTIIYKEKIEAWHDKRIARKEFRVGDIVLLFNSRLRLFPSKLYSRWTRPFEVTKVMPSGAVEIKSQSADPFMVNGQRLKHYANGDIPTYYSLHKQPDLHHCWATDIKQSVAWEVTHGFIVIYFYIFALFFSSNNADLFYSY